MHSALQQIVANALTSFRPPPPLTVSGWADSERQLSSEASAEPGQWDTSRAEYQRGMMDAFNDPAVETVVGMTSAQVGKTEALNNVVAYFVDHEPAPMLILQPTLDMAEAWSKDRLAPMLRDTPALAGKVADARARDSGNTLLHKSFAGGHITMAGANSPSSLASRPIRVLLADEVDRYPLSAGTEGDPVELGAKRTTTFWNRRIGLFSTPTIKNESRIEKAFLEGDQRRYHVRCPHCEHEQALTWGNVKWNGDDHASARYLCADAECGVLLTDAEINTAIKTGRWIASAPFTGTASFHIWEIYSPWRTMAQIVASFLKAKRGGPEMLKVWTNTCLGETWENVGADKQDPNTLKARAENYAPLSVNPKAMLLTVGVDTQNDRLAVKIKGWGRGEESWLVWWGEMYGDPSETMVWDQLTDLLDRDFVHPNGQTMRVSGIAIDSGGQRTQYVYDYVRRMKAAGYPIYAVKGSNQRTAPVVTRPNKVDITLRGRELKGGVELHSIGVSTAKDTLAARLRKTDPGPGAIHFYDAGEDYFKQMTSEAAVQRFTMGQLYYSWEKVAKDARNEAWDCEVYAYAAARLIGIDRANWDNLERRFAPATAPDGPAPGDEQPVATPRKAPKGFKTVGGRGGLPRLGGGHR